MKRIIIVLAAALSIVMVAQKPADMVEIDDMWYELDKKNKTAMLTTPMPEPPNYSPYYGGDVAIPPTVEYEGIKYSVTSIGPRTFYAAWTTTLHLPATVTKVYEKSFEGMVGLRGVSVDGDNPAFTAIDSVLYSRDMKVLWVFPRYRAWEDWPETMKFEEYVIPEGVEEIYASFFWTGLKRLILPGTLKKAGDWAFDCETLTEIVLPESMEYLGDYCFNGTKIQSDLHVPESVTHIGIDCFSGTCFTSINIPQHFTYVGEGWFSSNAFLETVELHEGITKICSKAFEHSVSRLELPESLVELEECAFEGCEVQTMELPDGLTELPDDSFSYSDIVHVYLGNGIERIGGAFKRCEKLTDIYSPREMPPTVDAYNPMNLDNDRCRKLGKVNVHVRPGCAQTYLDSPWRKVGPIIEDLPDGVDEVGDDMAIGDDELCDAYSLFGVAVGSRLRFGEVATTLPKGLYIIRTSSGKSAKIAIE